MINNQCFGSNNLTIELVPLQLRPFAIELQNNIQTPLEVIIATQITAMSICCQHLIDVERKPGLKSPVSISNKIIIESGGRKTTSDNIVLSPLREMQRDLHLKCDAAMMEYEAELKLWKAKEKALCKAVEKKINQGLDSFDIEQSLAEHIKNKPIKPLIPKLLYEDTTIEALLSGLDKNWPSAGLCSSEAEGIFNGQAIRRLAPYNLAWDGADQSVDRKSGDSFLLTGIRLSVSLMVQPAIFFNFINKRGDSVRGSGFLSRFLISMPNSNHGSRLLNDTNVYTEHTQRFHAQMRKLMTRSLESGKNPQRAVLKFTPDAQAFWYEEYNAFESSQGVFGVAFHTRDHASKAADNMARLAALLHYFFDGEGDIPLETLISASRLIRWYEDEYIRLFSPKPKAFELPQDQQDAEDLMTWHNQGGTDGWRYVKKNFIRQYGINRLRDSVRLRQAINRLKMQGRIAILDYEGTTLIDFYPNFPYDAQHWQHAINTCKRRSGA